MKFSSQEYHSLVKNITGEGKGGLKETEGLFKVFFPWIGGGVLAGEGLFEIEGFIEDLQ